MIGNLLKQERNNANLTQKQLAEKSKISFVSINRIERGSNPRLSVAMQLFEALGKKLEFTIAEVNVG